LARRGGESESATQIFLISANGGEARPLTSHSTAVSNPTWSADAKLVYFRAANAKSAEQRAREKLKDDVFMLDEGYEQQHLWSISLATGEERRVTQGDYSILGYQLSADGRAIAVHRAPTPLLDDAEKSEIWVINTNGSDARQITHNSIQETEAEI